LPGFFLSKSKKEKHNSHPFLEFKLYLSFMKKLLFILSIFVSGVIWSQVPTTGLISHWPFSGNANDAVGGNNGSVFNATLTPDRFGNPNCAYKFDGFTSYIKALAAGPTGTVSRSVSFWAKRTATTAQQCAFDYGTPGGIGSYHIIFNYSFSCQGIGFDNGSTTQTRASSLFTNGNWHHFVLVFDNSISTQMNNMIYYVDGVAMSATVSCGANDFINSGAAFPITIGRTADASSRYFNGDLDDFFLYNRALTPAEVLALYNDVACSGTPPAPGSISGNISVCQSASYIYSVAPVVGATSYSWTFPGGWTGTSTSNTILVNAGASSGTIMVSTGNCCGSSQPTTMDVNVSASPALSVSATQFTICNGNSTTLSGNGASTYTWNSFVISPGLVVSPTVTTIYTLSGTNSSGCSASITTTVNVTNNTLPAINVTGPGLSCANQTVNLASNGAQTYTWQPGNLTGFFVSVSPSVTTNYTVTGTDANGCYNSAVYTQTVSACAGIEALNKQQQFSIFPNPSNGSFTVKCKGFKEGKIEVLNETGQIVLEKILDSEETKVNTKLQNGIYFVRIYSSSGRVSEVQKLFLNN
jgi:hypothetical protein